jgi:Fe-S-cluster containining protein
VSCWNVCCHGADVTLTPCDILILAKHFMLRPAKFVAEYTVPAIHEGSGLPVPKLLMTDSKDRGDGPGDGKGPCVFMDEEAGCTVYGARPVTCRYYPMGLGAIKMKGHERREDMYFLVKEAHCKGHFEDREQTVAEFRKEQGVEPYDLINERWIDILMQMASWRSIGGPMGRDVSKQTKKMFYMVSTDVDAFRRFVFETKFLDTYDIDEDMVDSVRVNDEALLQLGFDWLRNVMFNDPAIGLKKDVLQHVIGKAREGLGGT